MKGTHRVEVSTVVRSAVTSVAPILFSSLSHRMPQHFMSPLQPGHTTTSDITNIKHNSDYCRPAQQPPTKITKNHNPSEMLLWWWLFKQHVNGNRGGDEVVREACPGAPASHLYSVIVHVHPWHHRAQRPSTSGHYHSQSLLIAHHHPPTLVQHPAPPTMIWSIFTGITSPCYSV